MSKKLTITGLMFILALFHLDAQITGGGERQSTSQKKNVQNKTIDNKNFIKLGLAMPTGSFGNEITATNPLGGGAKSGLAIQYGALRYFNVDLGTDLIGIGWDVPLLFSWNKWDSRLITNYKFRPYFFLGIGVGPLVTVNPTDELLVDVFFNLVPTVTVFGGARDEADNSNQFFSQPAFVLRKQFGFNIRYKSIFLGMDWIPGEVEYNVVSKINGEEIDGSPNKMKSGIGSFNLSFGLVLNP